MRQTHDGWNNVTRFPGHANVAIRGSVSGYHVDKKGRTRWDVTTREGAQYRDIELLTPAGFMSSPKVGDNTEIMLFEANGDPGQMVGIIIGDSEKRQQLPAGWAGMAQPDNPDHYVRIDDDGNIRINAPGKRVILEAAKSAEITAETIKLKGRVEIEGDIVQNGSISSSGPHAASAHV